MTIAYQVNILYQNGELTDITKRSEVASIPNLIENLVLRSQRISLGAFFQIMTLQHDSNSPANSTENTYLKSKIWNDSTT
jgi:hypothetical protein